MQSLQGRSVQFLSSVKVAQRSSQFLQDVKCADTFLFLLNKAV